jgi:hypothetical protein
MLTRTITGITTEEIELALLETLNDRFSPSLAIVFLSVSQDRDEISRLLGEKGISIFGATTHGEFTERGMTDHSTAIMLLELDRELFSVYFDEFPQKNYRQVAREIAKKALAKFPNPAFLLACSHLETDAEELLFGFEEIIGPEVNIYGGMAGDDYLFEDQYVFTNGRSSNRGVVVVVFNEDRVSLKGESTCGWKAVGVARTVTRSEGNHVFTVDDEPALDITTKFSGMEDVNEQNHTLVLELATNFPLQLQREKGDPVMRPALRIDWSDRSFICSGSIPQGSKVRFSLPPDFDVIEKVIDGCRNLKKTSMPEADAVIVFNCGGRRAVLGPLMTEELEGIYKVWNAPMAGMFSNAELGRASGGNLEMHNLTTCCVVLKEIE